MYVKHQLTLDNVLFCAYALCVLDHRLPGFIIGVDEVCYIADSMLQQNFCRFTLEVSATFAILSREEIKRYLLAEVGYKPGTFQNTEFVCTIVFLFGGVITDALIAVLIPASARSEWVAVSHCRLVLARFRCFHLIRCRFRFPPLHDF